VGTLASAPRYVAVALLLFAPLLLSADVDRIEGFDAYRFGMTLAEADAL